MISAHEFTNRLQDLLARERVAMADFLLAVAEFDEATLWLDLGYASLFDYLHRELGLSNASTFLLSKRDGEGGRGRDPAGRGSPAPGGGHHDPDARVAAGGECRPRVGRCSGGRGLVFTRSGSSRRTGSGGRARVLGSGAPFAAARRARVDGRAAHRRADPDPPDRGQAVRGEAREGEDALSHVLPGAGMAEVLEAGLDLLIERHEKRRGLVEKPRATPPPCSDPGYVPAHVRREVWKRDAGRCQWPLPSGGICGSTLRVELDLRIVAARGGAPTAANLRCLCRVHNDVAAREVFGDEWMDRYTTSPRSRSSV